MSQASILLKKYDVPAPRYTSYPTVPYWTDTPTTEQWLDSLTRALKGESSSWSLYLHMPFCETLCTFCGCNTSITKDHKREEPYVGYVLKEWERYKKEVPNLLKRPLKNVHLGGGTPTFFSSENLTALLKPIFEDVVLGDEFEASIEVDPRRTTLEQLEALYKLGFRRISLGVQDFNPEVQRIVNRIQPLEMTTNITEGARRIGYTSVNYDLIYGLPKQTPESVREMVEITVSLRPDRIAFYSFALVPWIKPQQRLFKDEDVPKGEEKRKLYEIGREILLNAGYVEIGMDHFALADEALAVATNEGRLHRNFMGYTDQRTDVLLGLGVSSISESPDCFHQNEKVLPVYERRLTDGEIPTKRGHVLSRDDQFHREQILDLMTRGKTKLKDSDQEKDIREFLASLFSDHLVEIKDGHLEVLPEGKAFLRNICMGFDYRMRAQSPEKTVFSQSV